MGNVYLLVSGSIDDQKKVAEYKEVAGPIMKKYGGRMPPENYQVLKVLAGAPRPTFMTRVAFPGRQEIEDAFNDPEYKTVVCLRDEGFGDLGILIVEAE